MKYQNRQNCHNRRYSHCRRTNRTPKARDFRNVHYDQNIQFRFVGVTHGADSVPLGIHRHFLDTIHVHEGRAGSMTQVSFVGTLLTHKRPSAHNRQRCY